MSKETGGGMAHICLPPKQEKKQRVSNTHESGTDSNYDGAYSIGSPPPPPIHDEVGHETASKTTNSEDRGQDGEGNVGHGDTAENIGRGDGEEGFWYDGLACQDNLDLIENRNVIAILRDVRKLRREVWTEYTWKTTIRDQKQTAQP